MFLRSIITPVWTFSRSEPVKEVRDDHYILDSTGRYLYSQFVLLEQFAQPLAVHQVNRCSPGPDCFIPRSLAKLAGGNQQAFLASSGQRAAKIPDGTCRHRSAIPFALEIDRERHQ